MKKGLIFGTALAMVLSVGVAVGAHQNIKEAKAFGDTVLYCKMTYDWWKADGAAIGCYYWISSNDSDNNAWPGDRMTPVENDTDVWKFAIPEGYDRVIFTRINGTGGVSDWGAKTGDLTIPTDGKNLYTITSKDAVWGDPGVTGEWSVYEEPEDPNYTVYIGGNGFALEPELPGDHLAQYHGKANVAKGEVVSFKADDNVLGAIADSTDSNNVFRPSSTILEDGENVDVWLKKDRVESAIIWTYWIGGRDEAHHYYLIVGNKLIALARYEEQTQYEEYYATGVALEAGQQVKLYVTELYNGEVKEGSSGVSMNEGVMTVDEDGVYDIYYAPSANNYVYFGLPVVEHTYKFKVGVSGSYNEYEFVEVDKGEYDAQYKTVADVNSFDEIHALDIYNEEEHLLSLSGDYDQYNNVYAGSFIMFSAKQVDVYLKLKNSQWFIYVGGRQSEYVLIHSSQSSPKPIFEPLISNPSEEKEVMMTGVELVQGEALAYYYKTPEYLTSCDSKTVGVIEMVNTQVGPEMFTELPIVQIAGTYNIYINTEAKSVYLDDPSDADVDANAYIDTFLDKLSTGEGAVCKADGTTTLADLQTAWGELKTAFADLSADAKAILKNASASANNVRGQFAKLYDYIVKKYGSAVCEDFVNRFNGEVILPNSNIGQLLDNSTPFMAPVVAIIALATITAIGAGLYFQLRKKEKNLTK